MVINMQRYRRGLAFIIIQLTWLLVGAIWISLLQRYSYIWDGGVEIAIAFVILTTASLMVITVGFYFAFIMLGKNK